MGKATILSELGEGRYNIKMKYGGRAENVARIEVLNARIVELEADFAAMPETTPKEIWEKQIVGLQIKALEKRVEILTTQFPADPTFIAWNIDRTTGLTGDVGILEVPGEYEGSAKVNIVAGFVAGSAAWNKARDGQLTPSLGLGPWGTFLNQCMLPGWQKFDPLYRYGTIVLDSIDFTANTCDVCLDPEYSSQLNLAVNQDQQFNDCDQVVWTQFENFCADNPTHPTCTNTEVPSPIWINDFQFDSIKATNLNVNSSHGYENDASGYRAGDNWRIMDPGEVGDCEDFALTKMQELIDKGYPVKNLQMAIVATETVANHAVLLIQTNNRGTLILDNRYNEVREASTLPYRFVDYQRAGQDWRKFSTRLTAVPIVYRECNAEAFADQDKVVVKFENQNFSSPKVVGFKSTPASCVRAAFYVFGGDTFVEWIYSAGYGAWIPDNGFYTGVGKYTTATDTWADAAFLPHTIEVDAKTFRLTLRLLVNAVSDDGDKTWLVSGSVRTADYVSTGTPRPESLLAYNDRFDKIAGAWTARLDIADPERSLGHGWFLGGKVHIIGGVEWFNNPDPNTPIYYQDAFADHDAFDDLLNTWAAKASAGVRWGHAAFKIYDKGYVAGGSSGQYGEVENGSDWSNVLISCREYDTTGDAWVGKATLPKKFYATGGFNLTSKGYIIGGWNTVKDIQEFDPVGNTWTAKTDKTADTRAYCGQQVGAGTLAFAAGIGPNKIERYNPETDTWNEVASDFHTSCSWGQRFTT